MVDPLLLLGGGAQQEQRPDPLALHLLLLAPGPADGFAAVVLRDDGLDHDEQVDVPAALLRVVDQHGEVAAVPIEQELLEVVLQPFEPIHLAQVVVGRAVGSGDIPGFCLLCRHALLPHGSFLLLGESLPETAADGEGVVPLL